MFKKLMSLICRRAAQPLRPLDAVDEEDIRESIRHALLELREPSSLHEEKEMSDRALSRLVEDAFLWLPHLHKALNKSKWGVHWQNGEVRFVFMNRAWMRFSQLVDHVRVAVEEAAEKPESKDFCKVYLSAVCSEIATINRYTSEMSDEDYESRKRGFIKSLQSVVGPDWHVEQAHARHDFVLCRPSMVGDNPEAEKSNSFPDAHTVQ